MSGCGCRPQKSAAFFEPLHALLHRRLRICTAAQHDVHFPHGELGLPKVEGDAGIAVQRVLLDPPGHAHLVALTDARCFHFRLSRPNPAPQFCSPPVCCCSRDCAAIAFARSSRRAARWCADRSTAGSIPGACATCRTPRPAPADLLRVADLSRTEPSGPSPPRLRG